MYIPTLKEYSKLTGGIVSEVILHSNALLFSSIASVLAVIGSTYYLTRAADASSALLDKEATSPFLGRLNDFLTLSLMATGLRYIPQLFFHCFVRQVIREKFVENLKTYLHLPYAQFHSKTSGEIRFSIYLKVESYLLCPKILCIDLIGLMGTCFFTFINAYRNINLFSASIFFVVPVLYSALIVFYLKHLIIYHTLNLIERKKTYMKMFDKLSNYDVIKTSNMEEEEVNAFRMGLTDQIKSQLRYNLYVAVSRFLIRTLIVIPYVLFGIFALKYPTAMEGKTLFQVVLLYSALSTQMIRLMNQLTSLSIHLSQIRLESIHATETPLPTGTKDDFTNNIKFENVNLYHSDNLITENINLEIKKGEKVAVVGRNGTGKSTFIKSIFRFTKSEGRILIDGIDINTLTNKAIFDLISYIPQDDFTSDDSVMNNLKLGKRGCADDFVYEKARLMQAHETFEQLEDGYNTQAGAQGHRLSGGQKQKLSLVRAAIRDAPIFVLDEPTAAMDKEYESTVMEVLLGMEKTLVMIIHNKEYLDRFDRIIYLRRGCLGGSGSYDELMENNQSFKKFVESR